MPIRILSYNIHSGWGRDGKHDYQRLNRLFVEQNIDVVLLQEVDTRPPNRPTEQDVADLCGDRYPHFVAGMAVKNDHGWYGNAVMSRFPVLGHETVDVSLRGREPRNIMEVVVNTHRGILRLLNTHKGLNQGERRHQLEKLHVLIERERELPVFVGGDINEWHTSSEVMNRLNNALHSVKVGATFPTWCPLLHLDRIWCRPAGIIKSAKILKNRATKIYSDHYPVLAILEDLKTEERNSG